MHAGGLPVFDDAPSWGAVPPGEEAASLQAATVAAIDALQWVGSVWQQMQDGIVLQGEEEDEMQKNVLVNTHAVNAHVVNANTGHVDEMHTYMAPLSTDGEVTDRVLHEALQAARQREAQWYGETAGAEVVGQGQHWDVQGPRDALDGGQTVRNPAALGMDRFIFPTPTNRFQLSCSMSCVVCTMRSPCKQAPQQQQRCRSGQPCCWRSRLCLRCRQHLLAGALPTQHPVLCELPSRLWCSSWVAAPPHIFMGPPRPLLGVLR